MARSQGGSGSHPVIKGELESLVALADITK